jgi:antitoxin component YwqK of YwqJK toxin-antitoxin module
MKVLVTLGVLAAFAVSTCLAQQVEKRRPGTTTIWGPARSVRVEQTQLTSQNGQLIEGPRILIGTINYNEDGTKQERTAFRADGAIISRTNEVYAPDGKILETTSFKGNGDLSSRVVFKYDDNRCLIEQAAYRPNGLIFHRTTFVYEDNRRLHESVGYDENSVVLSRVTGVLDLKTHKIETVSQVGNNVVTRQSAFTDTPEGHIFEGRVNGMQTELTLTRALRNGGVEMTRSDPDGAVQSRQSSQPGRSGAEIIEYNPDGTAKSKSRLQSSFDSHGNVIRQVGSAAVEGTDTFRPAWVQYVTIEYYGND